MLCADIVRPVSIYSQIKWIVAQDRHPPPWMETKMPPAATRLHKGRIEHRRVQHRDKVSRFFRRLEGGVLQSGVDQFGSRPDPASTHDIA